MNSAGVSLMSSLLLLSSVTLLFGLAFTTGLNSLRANQGLDGLQQYEAMFRRIGFYLSDPQKCTDLIEVVSPDGKIDLSALNESKTPIAIYEDLARVPEKVVVKPGDVSGRVRFFPYFIPVRKVADTAGGGELYETYLYLEGVREGGVEFDSMKRVVDSATPASYFGSKLVSGGRRTLGHEQITRTEIALMVQVKADRTFEGCMPFPPDYSNPLFGGAHIVQDCIDWNGRAVTVKDDDDRRRLVCRIPYMDPMNGGPGVDCPSGWAVFTSSAMSTGCLKRSGSTCLAKACY